MERARVPACTICGGRGTRPQHWFLLMEDRWADKLKILHWDDRLARRQGVHCACSAAHLQELVIHWMTTGSLDHPFALASYTRLREEPMRSPGASATVVSMPARQIGELSVHRESMQRVLRENPESVRTILDALLSALSRDVPKRPPQAVWQDAAGLRRREV